MTLEGNLFKMPTEFGAPIQYNLQLREDSITVNELLGKKVSISFDGRINCVSCGRASKKAFVQGFCYPCFITTRVLLRF